MSLKTLWETAAAGNAEAADVLALYRRGRSRIAAASERADQPAAAPADDEKAGYAFEFEVENLKVMLNGLNAGFEPLERARRQVALFRALAATDPEAYQEPLATWLGGHAYELVQRDRYEEAAAEFREAHALAGISHAHRAQLRGALIVVLEAIWAPLLTPDRWAEAAPFLKESSDLLYEDPPQRAKVLSTLAAALSGTDIDGALAAATESASIRRELGDRGGLALCLNNLGDLHLRSGNPEAALDCLREAVTIRRELTRGDPATFIVPLYRSLDGLLLAFQTLGIDDDESRACEAELSALATVLER